ncbi:MAG: hypothetical protein JXN62_08270, partial [Bacteroidales bacterium]|nr:hypothetical protein [Bacteroidales bacterium]
MRLFRIFLLSGFLFGLMIPKINAQCTVTGVSGSGFLLADFCAPSYNYIYYEFTFGTVAPPNPEYRVIFIWGDGSANTNIMVPVQTKLIGATTVYYVRAEADHTFPAIGNCEYNVNMLLYDNGACNDSRQVQIISNWHEDDVAAASGVITLNPTPRHDVCEGLPLIDFRFSDASTFACNIQQYPTAQKPNHTFRKQQYIYGTNPVAGRGIPNLFIKVGTAQTLVRLTENDGSPVPNSWTVDPVTGGNVALYSTASGYFEGPVDSIPVDAVTGVYSLPQTYPILFDGIGTVYQDQFQVTLRNWNYCNPYPGTPNTATALIYIVDGPLANAGPDASICSDATYDMDGILVDGTSALWTTTGNGSFANATSPANAVYTPGSADISAGYVDLVLHAYGTGMCPEHTDTMRLTLDPIPDIPIIVIISGSGEFCDDNSTTVNLRSSVSPNGNYLWRRNGISTGVTTRNIFLSDYTQSGDYTVTVYGTTANACPRTSAPFPIRIDPPPTATVGPDQNICGDINTVVTLSGNHSGNDLINGATGLWTSPSIWKEDFNDLPDGTTVDVGTTAWSRTVGVNTDYAEVRSQKFEVKDADAQVVWSSEIINISGKTDVAVSIFIGENGSLENDDYIRVYYKLDGGSELQFDNGIKYNDFETATATASLLNGTDLQIIVRIDND